LPVAVVFIARVRNERAPLIDIGVRGGVAAGEEVLEAFRLVELDE